MSYYRLRLLIEDDRGLSRWETLTLADLKSPVQKHPVWKKAVESLSRQLAEQLDTSGELK